MEATPDEIEQAKRAGEHEAARTELMRLIDNPEKHLPVETYRMHIRRAQQEVARTYKAMLTVGTW